MTPESFRTQLRPLVEELGTTEAANAADVSKRILQLWMRGDGNPNASTRAGVILLLEAAKKRATP